MAARVAKESELPGPDESTSEEASQLSKSQLHSMTPCFFQVRSWYRADRCMGWQCELWFGCTKSHWDWNTSEWDLLLNFVSLGNNSTRTKVEQSRLCRILSHPWLSKPGKTQWNFQGIVRSKRPQSKSDLQGKPIILGWDGPSFCFLLALQSSPRQGWLGRL